MSHSELAPTDRRVQRTRKLLQDALVALTIEKGFAAVTVRDITEHAGVNRATFYRHYLDKLDMLDHYAEEVYQLLETPDESRAPTEHVSADAGSQRRTAGMVKLFEHIRAHAAFYRVMLGQNGDPAFAGKIQSYIQHRLSLALPDGLRAHPLFALYLSYVSSGSLGAVLWWLDHEAAYSPADMVGLAIRLSAADLRAVLGHDIHVRAGG